MKTIVISALSLVALGGCAGPTLYTDLRAPLPQTEHSVARAEANYERMQGSCQGSPAVVRRGRATVGNGTLATGEYQGDWSCDHSKRKKTDEG